MHGLGYKLEEEYVCFFCFINPILGNRDGPGISSRASQGDFIILCILALRYVVYV